MFLCNGALRPDDAKRYVMRLSEAALHLGVSKQKLWRAIKAGKLDATKKTKGSKRGEYFVTEENLERYRSVFLDSGSYRIVTPCPEPDEALCCEADDADEALRCEADDADEALCYGAEEALRNEAAMRILVEKLHQEQRRSITLELQLQQSQNLLCERNEDEYEREARALEAEAKAKEAEEAAESARQESEQAKLEVEKFQKEAQEKEKAEEALKLMAADLQALKTEMATKEVEWSEARKPWYKKLFRKSS